jgi:two-component system, NtrC family, sensor kinase
MDSSKGKDVLNNKLQILGKLSASLIHEIRNPLSVIKLNLDYLSMLDEKMSDEVTESISACSEATERLLFLVENFSDFSKKHNLDTEICSINDVTKLAVNIMQVNATRINMYIDTELQDDLPSIYFQKDKLLQVFINLINNAIEAENKKETIFVRTYLDDTKNGSKIFWEVEDNGKGIKENQRDKIFQDFYTSKKKGTGLGLSVCKTLLKEYNAEIDFKSKPGLGTKFFIQFNPNNK